MRQSFYGTQLWIDNRCDNYYNVRLFFNFPLMEGDHPYIACHNVKHMYTFLTQKNVGPYDMKLT